MPEGHRAGILDFQGNGKQNVTVHGEKELITRKELKEDARLKQILLTKKGEQQHLKMMNFFSGMEKLLVDGMTKEEADELSSLLKRVRHNLEKNL